MPTPPLPRHHQRRPAFTRYGVMLALCAMITACGSGEKTDGGDPQTNADAFEINDGTISDASATEQLAANGTVIKTPKRVIETTDDTPDNEQAATDNPAAQSGDTALGGPEAP